MFTGIVKAVGTVASIDQGTSDARLEVEVRDGVLDNACVGDSMCVAGVCLTIRDVHPRGFCSDVSAETLATTTIGTWERGKRVNLEPALAAGARLGGHVVTGHVDGLATLSSRRTEGRSVHLAFEFEAALLRYVARKGSICIDGVSLTVNTVTASGFEVCIIPHTLDSTTLNDLHRGETSNVEVDLFARYVERLLAEVGPESRS